MSARELLTEQFHREVCVQEQAQLRKKLTVRFETEIAELKQKLKHQELLHEKEKISLRWQQDDQVCQSDERTFIWVGSGSPRRVRYSCMPFVLFSPISV